MSEQDLKTTQYPKSEGISSEAEQFDDAVAVTAEGSADSGVDDLLNKYADISDTMVGGRPMRATIINGGSKAFTTSDTIAVPTAGTGIQEASGTEASEQSKAVSSRTTVFPKEETAGAGKTLTLSSDEVKAATRTITSEELSNNTQTTTIPSSELRETQTGMSADLAGKGAEKNAESQDVKAELDPETEAIKERIRERKREKIRKARRRRARLLTILSIIFLSIGGFLFSISSFFTVDSIEVNGNNHFTAEEIINIAHAVPGHNLIYNPGSQEIVEYLEQNPYIKSAEVTKKYPSTLVITVKERVQACAFRYDDDYLIMDDEGILLKKTRTAPKTTMIRGLVVSKIKLGEKIGTEDQKLFANTMKIVRATKASDLYFVTIDMSTVNDDFQVRAYIYDNLLVRSEYDNLLENLDNGRLHKVVENLFNDGIKRGTIIVSGDGSISYEPGL